MSAEDLDAAQREACLSSLRSLRNTLTASMDHGILYKPKLAHFLMLLNALDYSLLRVLDQQSSSALLLRRQRENEKLKSFVCGRTGRKPGDLEALQALEIQRTAYFA